MTAQERGYDDATRGQTANPYSITRCVNLWNAGFDEAFDRGLAKLPRFGNLRRKKP